jgi:hypothetical protein
MNNLHRAAKMSRVVRKLPLVGAVAAVSTIGALAVSSTIKTVAGVKKDSTADVVIDLVSDIVVSTACLLVI